MGGMITYCCWVRSLLQIDVSGLTRGHTEPNRWVFRPLVERGPVIPSRKLPLAAVATRRSASVITVGRLRLDELNRNISS